MKINIVAGKIEKQKTGAAIIPVFEDGKLGLAAGRIDKALNGAVQRLIKGGDFKPKAGAVSLLYPDGKIAAERLLLAGLGKKDDLTPHPLGQAAGEGGPLAGNSGAEASV